MAHVLKEVSVPAFPALDGALQSVYLGFFHEDILTPVVPDGLRAS